MSLTASKANPRYGEFGGPSKTRVFDGSARPGHPSPHLLDLVAHAASSARHGRPPGQEPRAAQSPRPQKRLLHRPTSGLGHYAPSVDTASAASLKSDRDVAKSNVFRAPRWPPTLRPWHGSRASAASPSTTTRGRWRTTCCHAMAAAVERQQLRGRVEAGCDARGIRVEFGPRWRTGDTG